MSGCSSGKLEQCLSLRAERSWPTKVAEIVTYDDCSENGISVLRENLVEMLVAPSKMICVVDDMQMLKDVEQDLSGKKGEAGHFRL